MLILNHILFQLILWKDVPISIYANRIVKNLYNICYIFGTSPLNDDKILYTILPSFNFKIMFISYFVKQANFSPQNFAQRKKCCKEVDN